MSGPKAKERMAFELFSRLVESTKTGRRAG